MNTPSFISRLNWRLLVIHTMACSLIMEAAIVFSSLYNVKIVIAFRQLLNNPFKPVPGNSFSEQQFNTYALVTQYAGYIGFLLAIVLSLIITLKRRWYWQNTLVVALAVYVLMKLYGLSWTDLQAVLSIVGRLFNSITIELIFNGSVLLALGLLLFFLPSMDRFIETGRLGSSASYTE